MSILLWMIGLWIFFSSGLGLICLYVFLQIISHPLAQAILVVLILGSLRASH